ncbi:MFS transporter [Labrys wisconsinensis]|uniref:FSR family fosmidomycin resistance protein-like MFS transporter n=1 Tax=Labrys wisconsinensis TaxID=425677 RepID=A0ABU0JF53_9HYPH|nr:MFS transporter [Labrys wisconsinensis]MDQ0472917.1 FSR family fosmidomycin resistance protein-like MFS transporter [Labrys wisconsinensis]
MNSKAITSTPGSSASAQGTVYGILAAISVSHMLNDMIQSLIPAIYPMIKENFALTFGEIGLITLAFQLTASLLQPLVGLYTDYRPKPYSLPIGMGLTLVGLILLAFAGNFAMVLVAAALVGMGSSVFHPESSRVARMASGGRPGLAQSVFQVGGNVGSSLGPLLAAFVVLPFGQHSIAAFSAIALLAIIILWNVGNWYAGHRRANAGKPRAAIVDHGIPRAKVVIALAVLIALMFSKFVYLASLSSYYTFYLIDRFGLSVQAAQLHLFIYLFAVAAGTVLGGLIGDRFGRKYVIWGSILGVLPFTLALPYANLFWTGVLAVIIGFILSSAFSAIVVFAQELVPGKVGMISGLFFGFAFGLGGLGAAVLGELADHTSIEFVYFVCSFLPAIGLFAVFLPNLEGRTVKT